MNTISVSAYVGFCSVCSQINLSKEVYTAVVRCFRPQQRLIQDLEKNFLPRIPPSPLHSSTKSLIRCLSPSLPVERVPTLVAERGYRAPKQTDGEHQQRRHHQHVRRLLLGHWTNALEVAAAQFRREWSKRVPAAGG